MHLYGKKKKAAKSAVDKARNDMGADVCTKLDEDAGKKMKYKMARHRNEYSKDVKKCYYRPSYSLRLCNIHNTQYMFTVK